MGKRTDTICEAQTVCYNPCLDKDFDMDAYLVEEKKRKAEEEKKKKEEEAKNGNNDSGKGEDDKKTDDKKTDDKKSDNKKEEIDTVKKPSGGESKGDEAGKAQNDGTKSDDSDNQTMLFITGGAVAVAVASLLISIIVCICSAKKTPKASINLDEDVDDVQLATNKF